MGINKVIEIYLPNNTDSLNKEMLEKQSSITKILKGTPFEKDTNAIFEHLVRVQSALHITESNMQSRKEHLKEDLDVIRTLLAFHTTPQRIELRCFHEGAIGSNVNLPQAIIESTTLQIKDAAVKLFNQSPYLFCGKDGEILSPANKKHLKAKEKDLEIQIEELNIVREKVGKATYTKEAPNKITDTFRLICGIKFFCQCDGYEEWEYRGGKSDRNRCIFDCLQVFGYSTIRTTTDEDETERQRQYIKKKVRDAEKSNIVFISLPI